ncbi:MAG: hypothetical protein ABI400_09485 [Lacisediminihabitans sp.]
MTEPVTKIRETFAEVASRLERSGAKDEIRADLTTRRLLLGLVRPPVFVPRGRVWRLGVLLLGHDQTLYATGLITRVTDTPRPTFQSNAAEERRGYRALALRSGLPKGATVNFNAPVIALDRASLRDSTGPLFLQDDLPSVRWSHSLGGEMTMSLDDYLRDRVELLVHPPEGA